MPNSSSNTEIVVELRLGGVTVVSTIFCGVLDVLEEKSMLGSVLAWYCSGGLETIRGGKWHKGEADDAAGFSVLYRSAGCMGLVALADFGTVTATNE